MPLVPLQDGSRVEYLIDNSGTNMIDLLKTYLYVKCRVTKNDSTPVTSAGKVGLINLSLQSWWSDVQVYWKNRLVNSGGLYPY